MGNIRRQRCGCTNRNQTGYEPSGDGMPCAVCENAPCEFNILFGCDWTYKDTLDRDIIRARHFYPLRRECAFDTGIWVGTRSQVVGTGLGVGDTTHSFRLLGEYSVCNHIGYWLSSFPPFVYLTDYAVKVWGKYILGCVDPSGYPTVDHRCFWASNESDPSSPSAYPAIGYRAAVEWRLDTTVSPVELRGLPSASSGLEDIVYTCEDWVCPVAGENSRNNFKRVDGSGQLPVFPPYVCVVPGYTDMTQNKCTSNEGFCQCCDDGSPTANFAIQLVPCAGGDYIDVGVISTTRNATLPSGVSDPDGTCGYFWGTKFVSHLVNPECVGSGSGFTIGLLIWCDGTDWQASFYCKNVDNSYTFGCTVTATKTRCCPNFEILFNCDTSGTECCCTPGEPQPCCTGWPTTINYVAVPISGCGCGTADTGVSSSHGPPLGPPAWVVNATVCGVTYTCSIGCAGPAGNNYSVNVVSPSGAIGTYTASSTIACPDTAFTITVSDSFTGCTFTLSLST